MGVCYEIPDDGSQPRRFVVGAASSAEALKHHELPVLGERHQVRMNKIVVQRRTERINANLWRVTIVYQDPQDYMGAGI